MKLLKMIVTATALFGILVSGAHADRGDRDRGSGYSERRGHDGGWSGHRRDQQRHWDQRRSHDHGRHHGYRDRRHARSWAPPPPFAFWLWYGHDRDHRHGRW